MAKGKNELGVETVLSSYDDYYAHDQALPQNTTADGDAGSLEGAGGDLGRVEIVGVCSADISIADTKTFYVDLYESTDDATFTFRERLFSVTASGAAQTYSEGDAVFRAGKPSNLARYSKVKLVTDDPAASGSIDVKQTYLG